MSIPRVVVVDDHSLFRAGVIAELGDRIQLVGEAGDVATAVAVIESSAPDVVLLDVHLPGGGGAQVMSQMMSKMLSQGPSSSPTRYLAVSVSDLPEDVIGLVRAGARGYVTKNIGGDELAEAIVRVAEGDAFFSPRLAGFVLDAFRPDGGEGSATPGHSAAGGSGPVGSGPVDGPDVFAASEDLNNLTAREREVMRYLARGYSYKEIAATLFISVKTVETHASAVLRKLQLSSRYELSRWAADRDLL